MNVLIKPSKYDSFNPNNLDINKNHWKEVVLEYQKIFYFYKSEIFQIILPAAMLSYWYSKAEILNTVSKCFRNIIPAFSRS